MARRFGRVTIDDQGVRKAPLLWLFGSPFDVAWAEITGWASSEQVLAGGAAARALSRSVELHTAKTVHFIDVPEAEYAAVVEELDRRLPGKRTESILITVQRFRGAGQ